MIERTFEVLARLLFILVTLALFGLALALVASGAWELVTGALQGEAGIYDLMNGVGLLIVALAIGDVAKFVFEENIVRERELRAPAEALRSLTKFMTIIIIALSLEGVVGLFEAGRNKTFDQMVFPTLVMVSAILAVVGLGTFQFLSRRSQREAAAGSDDADADERAPRRRDG
jgi:small basic protein